MTKKIKKLFEELTIALIVELIKQLLIMFMF